MNINKIATAAAVFFCGTAIFTPTAIADPLGGDTDVLICNESCKLPDLLAQPLPTTRCVRVWLGVTNSCTSSKTAVLGRIPSLTPATAGTLNARDGLLST